MHVVALPVARIARASSPSNAKQTARDVVELERLRVGDRAERGAVDARHEHPGQRPRSDGRLAGDDGDIGDHDARLLQEAELELERRRLAERLEQRPLTERLRDDHVDEVGLVARDAPDVLEQRLHPSFARRNELQPGAAAVDPLEPARMNRAVGTAARDMDRLEPSPAIWRAYQTARSVASSIASTAISVVDTRRASKP